MPSEINFPVRMTESERRFMLSECDHALHEAGAGHGSLLIIAGGPGSGRSALLHRLAGTAAGGTLVLRAEASLLERDLAFGVLHQAFQPLVAAATEEQLSTWFAGAAGPARPVLAGDPADGEPPAGEQIVQQAVRALLANLGAAAATLLTIDDLQWADRPSLRCLSYLARRLAGTRVLVAAVLAEECPPADRAPLDGIERAASRTLRPGPLGLEATARLVSEQFAAPCDDAFAQACDELCAGNPALLVALARSLRARGVRPVGAHAAEVRAEGPQALLDRRLFLLSVQPPPVRDLARAMAILDGAAEPTLLGDLAGLDDTDYRSAVQVLDRLGLLARRDPPGFVDDTVRRAVESEMTIEIREVTYGRAATLLYEAGHPVETVAEHLLMVMSGYEPWQADVLREAAAGALDRAAGRVAARYLRHALLDSVPGSEDRARLLVDLAAAERSFDLGSAARHFTQAIPALSSARQRAAAATWIPVGVAATDEHLAALIGRAASEPAAGNDLALCLEARARGLGFHDPAGLAAAAERLRGFGPDLPLAGSGGRELVAVLLYAATLTAAVPAGEVACLARRILGREPPLPAHAYTFLPLLVPAMVAAGAAPEALRWLEAVRAQSLPGRVPGEPLGSADVLVDAQWSVVLASTRPARAAAVALEVLPAADPLWTGSVEPALWTLARIALDTRDAELGERVLAAAPGGDDFWQTVTRRMVRGMIQVVEGDHAGALDRFLDGGRQLARSGVVNAPMLPWRIWAAPLAWHLGDRDAAMALADAEDEFARAWDTPTVRGRAMRMRAGLAGGAEGVELLRNAAAVLRDSDDRVELSRTLTAWGRALSATGAVEAAGVLSEGRSIAAECGISWLGEEPDGPPLGPVFRMALSRRAGLSRAEEAVVTLAFRELTNQQIADELGITRRAVEKSLTSMYRKLRVSGRPALLAALNAGGDSAALGAA
jgi:DNA-binding CsgD family transcriptional regulator